MADIKAIAEELCGMTDKETEKIAAVLKEEYGIEPSRKRYEPKTDDKINERRRRRTERWK